MKIALLFDGLSALGKAPEVQLLDSIEAVESALSEWATEVVRVPVTRDGRWVERVRKGKFDLIFNLVEGIDGEAVYEPMVISVLELLGIPFTGSSSWTTALRLRKNVVNAVLDRAGLPVPRWASPASRRRGHERRVPRDLQAGRRGCFGRNRAAVGGEEHARALGASRGDVRGLGRGARSALHCRPRGERRDPRRRDAADRRDRFRPDAAGDVAHRLVPVEVGDGQR